MRKFSFLMVGIVALSLLMADAVEASHFRFGHITWRRLSGNQVEVTAITAWRNTFVAPTSGGSPLTTTFSWTPSASDAGQVYAVTTVFTDPGGLQAVCSFSLSVPSNAPPTAVAQDITVALDAAGNATITAADVDGGSSDPDGDPITLSVDVSSFDCDDLGPNTVTLTVTDNSGASDDATATVTVIDNIAPVLQIPGDILAECLGHNGTSVNVGSATATDNCGAVTITDDALSVFPLGAKTVTWTATDGSGNTTSGTQTVTIQDTTPPTLTIPGDIIAECTGPNGTSVDIGVGSAADDCDPNPVVTNDAPSVFPLGVTTVTWTATDAQGLSTSGTQTVTIQDTTDPVVTLTLLTDNLWPPNHKMHLVATGTYSVISPSSGSIAT